MHQASSKPGDQSSGDSLQLWRLSHAWILLLQVLLQHTAVCAAAVVGMPHERLGEQVAALVQVQIREPAISSSFGETNEKCPRVAYQGPHKLTLKLY